MIFQDTTECQAKQGVVVGRVAHGVGNKSCTTKLMLSDTRELLVSGGENLFRLIDKPVPVSESEPVSDTPLSLFESDRLANIARNNNMIVGLGVESPIKKRKHTQPSSPNL